MGIKIETNIKINGSKETIWKILTDFNDYANWNPFIKFISGDLKEGSQLTAQIDDMKFKPTVLVVKENETFEWIGRLLLPRIFDGQHKFQIIDNHDGSCTFNHSEKFKGILVFFMKKKLEKDVRENFQKMNFALKNKVEMN